MVYAIAKMAKPKNKTCQFYGLGGNTTGILDVTMGISATYQLTEDSTPTTQEDGMQTPEDDNAQGDGGDADPNEGASPQSGE